MLSLEEPGDLLVLQVMDDAEGVAVGLCLPQAHAEFGGGCDVLENNRDFNERSEVDSRGAGLPTVVQRSEGVEVRARTGCKKESGDWPWPIRYRSHVDRADGSSELLEVALVPQGGIQPG